MTHILEALTHTMEGQPPKKQVRWVLGIHICYIYIYVLYTHICYIYVLYTHICYIYICYIYVVYMYIYHPILSISKLMKPQVVEIQDLSLKAALPTSLRTKPGERGRWEPGEMAT